MTMLEAFVKERNEALFSLDRKKIEAYMIKYLPQKRSRAEEAEKHSG